MGMGRLVPVLCLLGLSAFPSAAGSFSWAYDIEQDVPNENYFNGYLTWNAGKGGIAWAPGAPSEPEGNPVPDSNAAQIRSQKIDPGWEIRTHLLMREANGEPVVPVDEFVSAPVPKQLNLNVSRGIMLDFYTKGCTKMELELWMGDTFIGGSIADVRMVEGKFFYTPRKTGLCGHPFGLHSEVDVIPAGSVLTLKFFQFESANPIYAMKDDNVLRIPLLSGAELALRSFDAGTSGTSSTTGSGGSASLVLLAVPLLAVPRGRRRTAWIVFALAGPLLSGCIGGGARPDDGAGPGPTGGRLASTLVPGADGNDSANGSLVGQVHDDLNIPISGVHAALLGTDYFATSNQYGEFQLRNVPVGQYRIRFDRQSYKTLETDVRVEAGAINRLDVTLAPIVAKQGGFRPHRHDYWLEGETSRELFAGPVVIMASGKPATSCDDETGSQNYLCFQDFRIPPDGKRNLVLPGTKDIEIKVTWDPEQNRVERAGILYVAPDNISKILMYPKPSGSSTHIRVNWGMNDYGHSLFSYWRLAVYVSTNSGSQRPTSQKLGGPFDVQVTIHRGPIPLEPGHRDFWGANTTIQVMEGVPMNASASCCPAVAKELIPPGTGWIDVVYEQSRATKQEYLITYRPGDVQPGTPYADHVLQPTSATPTRMEFRYDLKPGESDSFYAKKSNWEFSRKLKTVDQLASLQDDLDARVSGPVTQTVTVVAHRDPSYVSGGEE